MASIYDLKPRFQSLLRPLTCALASSGVTPNQITLAAIVLSVAGGSLIAIDPGYSVPLLLVPAILFVRMALNAIDGMLAREHDMKSDMGTFLNEVGDVVSDAVLYLPFALVAGVPAALVVVIVVMAIVSEMTGVVGVQINASRRYDGPMGKSDRAFLFGLLGLLLGLGVPTDPWLPWLLWIVVGLLAVTVINRARKALREET